MTQSREFEFGSKEISGVFDYAEMGNTVASDEVMNSADEWHALFNANIGIGLANGFTFVAGKEGAGNITTAAAGAAINIADIAATGKQYRYRQYRRQRDCKRYSG